MRRIGTFLAIFFALTFWLQSNAQYSFTPTLHTSGGSMCSAGEKEANKILSTYSFAGYPTKSQCEAIRAQVLGIKIYMGGCSVYYTASPCVGTEMNQNGNDIMNPTSSNLPIPNAGVEFKNELEDYEYMRQIQEATDMATMIVMNGNMDYSRSMNHIIDNAISESEKSEIPISLLKLNLNIDYAKEIQTAVDNLIEGYQYGTMDFISDFFDGQFERITGYDVNKLRDLVMDGTITYTDEVLIQNAYNDFYDAVLEQAARQVMADSTNENIPLEMAIYALHVYDDSNARKFDSFVSPLWNVDEIPHREEQKPAQEILDFLKRHNNEKEFQADFYYDKDKDKYVIAFRGTEGNLTDWLTDTEYLMTGKSPQHDLASQLADVINSSGLPKDKLTITGHSLGGGLAELAGLKTGVETYAYNPLHINESCVANYGLQPENATNVHAFQEKGEMLVSGGEVAANAIKSYANAAEMTATGGLSSIMKSSADDLPISRPVDVGETIIITNPDKPKYIGGLIYNVTTMNHKMGNALKGVAAIDEAQSEKFMRSREMAGKFRNAMSLGSRPSYNGNKTGLNFRTIK